MVDVPRHDFHVPAKCVRFGPRSIELTAQTRRVSYIDTDSLKHGLNTIDLAFSFSPNALSNGSIIQLNDSRFKGFSIDFDSRVGLTVASGFNETTGERSSYGFIDVEPRRSDSVSFKLSLRNSAHSLRIWVNGVEQFWGRNLETGGYIRFKDLSVSTTDIATGGIDAANGLVNRMTFAAGATPFEVPSTLIRITLLLLAVLLISSELLFLTQLSRQRIFLNTLVLPLTCVMGLSFISLRVETRQTISGHHAVDWLSRSDVSDRSFTVRYSIKFVVTRAPNQNFAYIKSFGRSQGDGFHLTIDHFGNIFLVLGRVGRMENEYALLLLSGPSPGNHQLTFQARSRGGSLDRLFVNFDGRRVGLVNARPNEQFDVTSINPLPAVEVSERSAIFESNYGSLGSQAITVSQQVKVIRYVAVLSGICAIISCLLIGWKDRRLTSGLAKNEGRSTSDFSESHSDIFGDNPETKKKNPE